MTDTAVILALSNISTASVVALIAFAALELHKERTKADAAQAKTDRAEAEKALTAMTESREHDFAIWMVQPEQQHAAADTPEPPALSAESHEDEQAADEDDDHTGWLRVLAALVWDLADLVHDHTPWGWLRIWFGPGETTADGIREVLAASGYDLGETAEEAFAIEVEAIRKASNLPYRGRHWLSDVQHTGTFPIVPAQRDGEVA